MNGVQKRQIAYKVSIATVLKSNYVKTEGWEPNYLELGEERISRVNIIGVVVGLNQTGSYETLFLEDGTEKISVRSFEQKDVFSKIEIGNIVMIIGKPREFNSEIYLIPEIIKKIENKKWIDVRLHELQQSKLEKIEPKKREIEKPQIEEMEVVEERVGKADLNKLEEVYNIIKELDNGSGADYENVIEKTGKNSDEIIKKLMKEGEIFEIAPGKLKIL